MITSSLRPALITAVVTAGGGIVAGVACAGSFGSSPLADGVRLWLVAHGSGLEVGSADITLVPIGPLVLAVMAATFAARWVAAHPIDEPAAFAAATGGFLGLIAGVASTATSSPVVGTSLMRASAGAFAVGLVGAAVGYSMRHGVPDAWRLRGVMRLVVREAATAGGAVIAAAMALVALMLVVKAPRIGDLWAALDPGFAGSVSLLGACLLSVPTGVGWATSVLLGPGFAVGADTSVDLTGAHLGELPAFPLLGALPGPGEFPGIVFPLMLAPLLAGLWSGVRVARARPDASMLDQAKCAAVAGAMGGVALGALTVLSSGGIGPGRMAEVGPNGWLCLLVAVPVLASGAALGAAAAHYPVKRAP